MCLSKWFIKWPMFCQQKCNFRTPMLRSDLCDHSDAYIVVKEIKSATVNNAGNRRNKNLTFKNKDPFRLCISKMNNTFIDNAEDLDIAMPMYNLLE